MTSHIDQNSFCLQIQLLRKVFLWTVTVIKIWNLERDLDSPHHVLTRVAVRPYSG